MPKPGIAAGAKDGCAEPAAGALALVLYWVTSATTSSGSICSICRSQRYFRSNSPWLLPASMRSPMPTLSSSDCAHSAARVSSAERLAPFIDMVRICINAPTAMAKITNAAIISIRVKPRLGWRGKLRMT